ncbi:hypothetical protein [uncultured Corynebacterium sp.]|uniref:alpha/beta hydrolase family esterase n=1 Tax=uncultured Corynebacterium sp. TaxID=159447 RepID=UPI0025FDBE39|nr:hypothetical protein [uncultured Corynebacterium sp.]
MKLERRSLNLQDRDRTFLVVRADEPRQTPDLLIFFHGSLQSGSVMRRFTAGTFDTLADRHGMIVAFPNGVEQHFNDARATLPVAARELGIDDVAFTQAIANQLRAEFGVGRIFACGFSNGGQMVIRLLFDAPGLLDGAAVFASTLGAGANHAPTNPDSAYHPTPVLFMHGTGDPLAPYDGGTAGIDPKRTRGAVTSAPFTAARFAELNDATGPDRSQPFADTTVDRWARADGSFPVELWTVQGMGHVVPSGNDLDIRLGKNTRSFLAADVVEDFFGLGAAL